MALIDKLISKCFFIFLLSHSVFLSANCPALKEEYVLTKFSYADKEHQVYDYSNFLAEKNAYKEINGLRVVSIKKLFDDWKDETFISIGESGHVAVVAGGIRFDGRLAYLRDITVDRTVPIVESGVLIRLRGSEGTRDDAVAVLLDAMNRMKGTKSLTCVAGACALARESNANAPNVVLPKALFEHILTKGLEWNGEKLDVQFISTEPFEINSYLDKLANVPKSLAWKGLKQSAKQGKEIVGKVYSFVVLGLKTKMAGFFFSTSQSKPE